MKGAEFLKRLRRLSRTTGVSCRYDGSHGKGSHGRLFYGDKFTTLKDPKKELGPGLLNAMLKDLGLKREDL